MNFTRHTDAILAYFKKNQRKGLTTWECILHHELGFTNLPRRICDLQEQGFKFAKLRELTNEGNYCIRYFLLKSGKKK